MRITSSDPSQIAKRAHDVLSNFHREMLVAGKAVTFEGFYPLDLERVAVTIDWTVEDVPFIGLANSYRVKGEVDRDSQRILIDIEMNGPRERNFTIAHELGHVILHQANPTCTIDNLFRTRSRKKARTAMSPEVLQIENEANIFARELLMPKKAVRRYFQELLGSDRIWAQGKRVREEICWRMEDPTVEAVSFAVAEFKPSVDQRSLCEFFGVSADAMARRLRELMLIFP